MSAPDSSHSTSVAPRPRWVRLLCSGEDLTVVFTLAAMMLLPVIEILLRKFFHGGVPASSTMVQHLVLAVGMLGGAIAARENRLLAMSATAQWLKGGLLIASRVVGFGFGAAVSALLCTSSWEFVQSQRSLGKIFAYGLPLWIVQLLLVIGFGVVAVRLVWTAAPQWRWRGATLALAVALIALALHGPFAPEQLRWPGMAILTAAVALGAPVFTGLGGAALILLWTAGEPVSPILLKHYSMVVNPTLPSIPLFTLAGYFLAESGAARRLVRVFQALFGGMRGGPAIVTTLVCAFFTSFTGASGATILALGGVLMPVLLAARYSERNALGLLTGAGALGMLFPPCLPPILFAIIASSGNVVSVSIEEMFQGGLLPGLLMVSLAAWWGVLRGPKAGETGRQPFDRREAWKAAVEAKWELFVPVVALTALFSGFATPVEAAALTAFYTFIVAVVIHRDLHIIRDVPRVMTECGLLIGGVMLILGVALGFTHFLVDAQIPDQAVEWTTSMVHSKWVFLLLLNVVLLMVGSMVEIYSAIIIVVPILVPIGIAYGIDPVHLGIIFLVNMELGFLTPPVGMNLLLASYRFKKPMSEVMRASLPMLGVMLVGVILITYVPWLTTWIPSLFR